MDTRFDGSTAARIIPFAATSAREWGGSCQAHDLIDVTGRRVSYESMPPGAAEVMHKHDRSHQVFHILSGTLMVEVNDTTLVAHDRDTIEVPPGISHRAYTQHESAVFIVFSTPSTREDRREAPRTAWSSARPRPACESDVTELVRLRRLMFDEMGIDTSNTAWEAAAHDTLLREMAADRLFASVVDSPDDTGTLVASGVVQFEVGLPFPGVESPGRAYISSMSTDRDWRGRGWGTEILRCLLAECEARGAEVIGLHATAQGQPIYKRHGFRTRGGSPEMRLIRLADRHNKAVQAE